MDDLILSHKNPNVVTKMISHLRNLYKKLLNGKIRKIRRLEISSANPLVKKYLRFRRKIMNHKRSKSYDRDYDNGTKNNANAHKKYGVAMVNVGMNEEMKSEYWSKKPGEKAAFV